MDEQEKKLLALQAKVQGYGKENQTELVYVLAEGVRLITGQDRIRIYLEDLIAGALTCAFASGLNGAELHEVAFPIVSQDALVSRVFFSQYPAEFSAATAVDCPLDMALAERFGIAASWCMPLVSRGRSIGVICVDSTLQGLRLPGRVKSRLADFVLMVGEGLDEARSYHQQVQLARRLEESKKREAAGQMVRSAVRLVDQIGRAHV